MNRLHADVDADRDLERRVTSFLAARHVPGLRKLAVQATGGVVTVSGRVLTFYEKQLANQCCRRVAGVLELINAVDVIGSASADTRITPGVAVAY
jgi:osmotically-inducible protein OsmY